MYGNNYLFGPSLVIYDSKTHNNFRNTVYVSAEYSLMVLNFYLSLKMQFCDTKQKETLRYPGRIVYKNEDIRVDYNALVAGYKFYFNRSKYSVDPYFGLLHTNIFDSNVDPLIDTKRGWAYGITLNRYISSKAEWIQFVVFVDNGFYVNALSDVSDGFGRYFYSLRLGVGMRMGDPF